MDQILGKIREETGYSRLKTIKKMGNDYMVTCPVHKDGQENKPSCTLYVNSDGKLPFGTFHCFTCGYKGVLAKFVGACFERNESFGSKWLKDNFTERILQNSIQINDPIILDNKPYIISKPIYRDMTFLDNLQSWHPYMGKRKLSKKICEQFNVKYDPKDETIVFPVYDLNNDLLFCTKRSINIKRFIIPPAVCKPVYLLNFVLDKGIKRVIVCESQINALYCWTLGFPAIALFGTGTREQYNILNNTDILEYRLAFDGDDAGDKGRFRFIRNIRKDVFVTLVDVPRGKDLNDLSPDECKKLLNRY